MRNTFIFLFLSIFLIAMVSGVPPVTTTQQFTEGYTLQIPQDNILTKADPYTFNFHVFNISNGLIITNNIGCEFHMYGHNGMILTDSFSDVSVDDGYSFTIDQNNLTGGNVYYFVHCNDSTLGGFESSIIEVTLEGDKTPDGVTLIFFMFMSVLIFLGLIWSLYKILEDLAAVDVTLNTVFIGFSAYISNLALYYYLTNFMPWALMVDISLLGITAFGMTHILLPLIGLIFTWIKNKEVS